MDGYRCLDLYAHDICTPVGGLEEGQECQSSQQCNSGICRGALCTRECPNGECSNDSVCIQNESINLCERRCADTSDCPAHSACIVSGRHRLCTTLGDVDVGDDCSAHHECRTGFCQGRTCAANCGPENECSDGYTCVASISGSHCRISGPIEQGMNCEESSQCRSGVCSAGRCSVDCLGGESCGAGFRCVTFAEGDFCFPTCRLDQDCPDRTFCDIEFPKVDLLLAWQRARWFGLSQTDNAALATAMVESVLKVPNHDNMTKRPMYTSGT